MSETDLLLTPGDKIFVLERRLYKEDLKRHFVGEVHTCTGVGFRASGYPFYYHEPAQRFVRKPSPRLRIFTFHSNLIIYLLPKHSDIDSVGYIAKEKKLILTDERSFELDVTDPEQR
jgi:hypothetical protein